MTRPPFVIALALMLGALQALPLAQTSVGEAVPAFEVASVKQNKSGEQTGPYFRYEGLQFVVVNNNLFSIIRTAWRLPAHQSWVDRIGSDRSASDSTSSRKPLMEPRGLRCR